MTYAIVTAMSGRRPEDTRLSDAFRVAYEAAGISQTQIADALPGIDQPAVSKWARGERPPPLWVLPAIDALCGQPKGHVLRLAGFVDDGNGGDVLAAIAQDTHVRDEAKAGLVDLYRSFRRNFPR